MSEIRAKFVCDKVEKNEDGTKISLTPVTNGSEENESFFSYTPYGSIEIGTVNPNVKFEEGKEYYVDFTLAE